MIDKKEKAAALTTAPRKNQLCQTYQYLAERSRAELKEQIGVLLLYLHGPVSVAEKRTGWRILESKLRHYMNIMGQEVRL